jgi:hypothetical protein
MDPRTNPYAPGAGTTPPELAGRDDLIERATVASDRIRNGLAARSVILYAKRDPLPARKLKCLRTDLYPHF